LRGDLSTVFAAGRRAFEADPDITGKQLYAEVERLAAEAGWQLGGWHVGHLVGEFPPEYNNWEDVDAHIVPANDRPLRRTDETGQLLHWILEIHLIDQERGFGGFYEELLDL
jgi:hypothetical protein